MFPDVDTRDANAVRKAIRCIFADTYPASEPALFESVFKTVDQMFTGKFPGFREVDVLYHDYQHTLQASLCMAEIMQGMVKSGDAVRLSERDFQLGMAAILLHDSGYLQTAADGEGSGARFTYAHVLRSCAVAATHLPRYGVLVSELSTVMGAIRCTGPDAKVDRLHFERPQDRLLGSCVATADYLGQMAASDYPDELGILFNEFKASDDYLHVPESRRMFKSPEDLRSKTPGFWRHVVLPKLQNDFEGAFRYLSRPYPDGPNSYVEAIERNIEIIASQTSS